MSGTLAAVLISAPDAPAASVDAWKPSLLLPALVSCALLMENLDSTVLNTVAHSIAADFQVSPLQLKFALTAYLVSLAATIPASGYLAERFGPRRIFSVAITTFSVGSLACGVSSNLLQLVLSRLVQGVGGALMVPVARLVLLRAYPKNELVRITNLTSTPSLIGPAAGPLIGGLLATYAGWRSVFYVNVPLGILGLWATRRALPCDARIGASVRLDWFAFISFGAALAGLSFAFECLGDGGLSASSQAMLVGGAMASLAAFTFYTAKVGDTLLKLSLFRVRTFALGVLGNAVSRLGIGSVPFLLPLMYQMRFDCTPLQAAVRTLPLAVGMLSIRAAVKPLLATFGFRNLLVANSLLLGGSLISLAGIRPDSSTTLASVLIFLYGAFASVHFACMNVLAYVDIGEADMGQATSIVSTVHTFALGAGVAFGALLVQLFLHQVGAPGEVAYAFHRSFLTLGVMTALSAALFFRLQAGDGAQASGHSPAA